MREIEGLEEAIKELSPYWYQIDAFFEAENTKYKEMLSHNTDDLSRILKCHLIVEHYLDNYILRNNNINNLEELHLSFFQKASLLPKNGCAVAIIRPGIIQLNTIRNKFAHKFTASIQNYEISSMDFLLKVARPNVISKNIIDRIEVFTTIVCTWLLVTPPELADVFQKVFSKISVT